MTLRETYPLHPNKVIKKFIENAAFIILSSLFISIILFLFSSILLTAVLCLLLLVLVGIYWWSKEYYKVYFYDLSGNGLKIKKGVFFPHSITIPLEKVSDVYIDQDIFDRILGLYDLHFSSASATSGAFAHIDGLDRATTYRLRALLMKSFKEDRGEAVSAAEAQAEAAESQKAIATFRPSAKGFWLELAGALVAYAFIIIYLFLGLEEPSESFGLMVLIFSILLAGAVALYVKKEYGSRVYEIRREGLWIRKGWLSPSETLLFYRNIQDWDISKSFVERILGLQTLVVKSMSSLSAQSARLTYLTVEDTKKIQELLQRQIEASAAAPQKEADSDAVAAAVPLQTSIIKHSGGERIVSPYKNDFVKGHLVGSIPMIAIFLLLALISSVAGALFPSFSSSVWLFTVIFVILAIASGVLAIISALIDRATYSYAIGKEGLVIELGLLSRHKKVIRYEKIQDIRIHCGFFESFVGLVNMDVETGSEDLVESEDKEGAAILTERIPYLHIDDANALRSKLLATIGVSYPKGDSVLRTACPLSPKKPLKKTVAWISILNIQLLLVFLLFSAITPPPLNIVAWALTALTLLRIAFSPLIYWYEQLYMQKYFYDANEDTLVIRKGVFGWGEIIVPFRNIQSIYIDQDWYDVYFNTWDVWITTVTATSGSMAHIDGTGPNEAEKLTRLLVDRVEKSRKKVKMR
ncbi:MAG: PH domain-containing protein [Candidatus Micrarchaeota archaeon]|nr:PH domain-containing protein [Candidatus Micrarchaeota archaeon]